MLSGFEGEIAFAIKDVSKNRPSPEVTNVLLQVKSDKVRAELPQSVGSKPIPKGYAVLNAAEKKLYVVMDEQKQIVVLDLNKTGEQFKSFGAGLPKGGPRGWVPPEKEPAERRAASARRSPP